MEQFPPNSRKTTDRGPKRVERVTTGDVRRRKQPLGTKFRQTFFGGDARTAVEYMVSNTVVPAAREMMVNAVASLTERVIYGDRENYRRGRYGGSMGHVNYNRMAQRGPEPRAQPVQMGRPNRMRHAFDQIVINSRQEAEEVLDRMYDTLSKYDSVSVADLYELTGIESTHTDLKWGWEELRGSAVGRDRRGGGYLLELPEPVPLG